MKQEYVYMNDTRFFNIYENVLPQDFCQHIIKKFELDERKEIGRVNKLNTNGDINYNVKNTTEIILDEKKKDWGQELNFIVNSLKVHLNMYLKPWQPAIRTSIYPETFRIAKYETGDRFALHSDNIGGSVTRIITAIWYLNDVSKGGETEYPWQNISIKPKAGRLLLCPISWTHIHQGKAPISSSKYIIITQLHQQLQQ